MGPKIACLFNTNIWIALIIRYHDGSDGRAVGYELEGPEFESPLCFLWDRFFQIITRNDGYIVTINNQSWMVTHKGIQISDLCELIDTNIIPFLPSWQNGNMATFFPVYSFYSFSTAFARYYAGFGLGLEQDSCLWRLPSYCSNHSATTASSLSSLFTPK